MRPKNRPDANNKYYESAYYEARAPDRQTQRARPREDGIRLPGSMLNPASISDRANEYVCASATSALSPRPQRQRGESGIRGAVELASGAPARHRVTLSGQNDGRS
ncbi:hypothetical protein MRX96_024984 [Rhipicephalus microplus]